VIGYMTVDRHAPPSPETSVDFDSVCRAAGWALQEVVHDEEPAGGLERPALAYALQRIAAGHARGLVVSDIERLAPSLSDLGTLLERCRDARAALVVPDLDLETTTVEGRRLASVLIRLGGLEPDPASQRPGGHLAAVDTGDERGRAS
jgi:hypothetical protein